MRKKFMTWFRKHIFCRHDWEQYKEVICYGFNIKSVRVIYYFCKKCHVYNNNKMISFEEL